MVARGGSREEPRLTRRSGRHAPNDRRHSLCAASDSDSDSARAALPCPRPWLPDGHRTRDTESPFFMAAAPFLVPVVSGDSEGTGRSGLSISVRRLSDEMIIRKASHDDIDAIASIHVASWQHTYRGILPDRLLDSLRQSERATLWSSWLKSPGFQAFVADEEGDVLGFTAICPARPIAGPPAHAFEITHLYVDARAQGRGVGTRLLRQALAAAEESSVVLLWVLEANQKARVFYEHFGFSRDGATHSDPAFLGNDARELRYRWAPGGSGG